MTTERFTPAPRWVAVAEMLESGQMDMGTHLSDITTEESIVRIKAWIGELNALLKEYARA